MHKGQSLPSSASKAAQGLNPGLRSLPHQFAAHLSQLGAGVPEESARAPKPRPSLHLVISLRIYIKGDFQARASLLTGNCSPLHALQPCLANAGLREAPPASVHAEVLPRHRLQDAGNAGRKHSSSSSLAPFSSRSGALPAQR